MDLTAMKNARWGETLKGCYRVILADPPWKFHDQGSRMAPSYAGDGRKKARYVQVDSNQRVKDMADFVYELGATDSLLFLWIPNVLLLEGLGAEVCRLWGYEPKQLWTWLKTDKNGKPRMGGGHYGRVCTESLILAKRGRPLIMDQGVPAFITSRRGEHSAKPDESYELIERLTLGPYVELFARRRWNEDWTVLGDQIAHKVKLC